MTHNDRLQHGIAPAREGDSFAEARFNKIRDAAIATYSKPLEFYVVTAYRWGQRNAHSYVVACYTDLNEAKQCATNHVEYRGGKYACEVTKAGRWDESTGYAAQVFYVESPYFGMAGDAGHFHPANNCNKSSPCPKPFTVRELQNRIFDLERQIAGQTKGPNE